MSALSRSALAQGRHVRPRRSGGQNTPDWLNTLPKSRGVAQGDEGRREATEAGAGERASRRGRGVTR